jgi:hypothetical protein
METLYVQWTTNNDGYYALKLSKYTKDTINGLFTDMKDHEGSDELRWEWLPFPPEECKYRDFTADLVLEYFGIDCTQPLDLPSN